MVYVSYSQKRQMKGMNKTRDVELYFGRKNCSVHSVISFRPLSSGIVVVMSTLTDFSRLFPVKKSRGVGERIFCIPALFDRYHLTSAEALVLIPTNASRSPRHYSSDKAMILQDARARTSCGSLSDGRITISPTLVICLALSGRERR